MIPAMVKLRCCQPSRSRSGSLPAASPRRRRTIRTATTDKIRTHLNAIKDDFNRIADAQGQLTDAAKQQVQNADEQFKSQVDDLITNLGTSV